MIKGVGVDICNINRLAELRARHGHRFLDRIFTPTEQARCGNGPAAAERYAARFAAKEAVMKALGVGWARGVSFRDIEVYTENSGRPVVRICGGAQALAVELGVRAIHASLSHERDNAVAFIVLES